MRRWLIHTHKLLFISPLLWISCICTFLFDIFKPSLGYDKFIFEYNPYFLPIFFIFKYCIFFSFFIVIIIAFSVCMHVLHVPLAFSITATKKNCGCFGIVWNISAAMCVVNSTTNDTQRASCILVGFSSFISGFFRYERFTREYTIDSLGNIRCIFCVNAESLTHWEIASATFSSPVPNVASFTLHLHHIITTAAPIIMQFTHKIMNLGVVLFLPPRFVIPYHIRQKY